MSNNARSTKRSRLSQQADSSDAPEAGPSTGVRTHQGSDIGPPPGPLDPSPYHISSAALEDTNDHEGSGTYNAQPGATNNPASDSTSLYLDQSSTGHAYPPLSGPPNLLGYEQQHSPLERITSSMREQQHARPAQYPQLFLDSRLHGNSDVHAAMSPSMLTANSSLGSPGPSSPAFASGRVEGASGRPSRKCKATDEDPDEEGLIPSQAPSDTYYQPTPGQIYVPTASLGQQQVPYAVYLSLYGNFTGAPALVPGVPGSASAPFAVYPSQPAYGLPASDTQASIHSAPSRPDLPALGGLRRSPRLARCAEGDEGSKTDGSPPQSALLGSAAPPTRSERDKSNRKRNAQNQRNKKVDRFSELNDLLENYRVVVVNNGKRKKWTPQQQILQNAIEYTKNVQAVRKAVMVERDVARVEYAAARVELEQERVEHTQERERLEQERANYQEANEELRVAIKDCDLGLMAKESQCTELQTQVQTLKGKVTDMQRQIDEFKCS